MSGPVVELLPLLRARALVLCGHRQPAADDLVEQVLLRAIERVETADHARSLEEWLTAMLEAEAMSGAGPAST